MRNLDKLIGQNFEFKVIKFNKKRGNIVLSRRVAAREGARRAEEGDAEEARRGPVLTGTVKNITDYGAFVDLGGIDGLLHITDMSWGRVGHPSEMLNVGDKVAVVVLKYDPESERVSLGMKQIQEDPWHRAPSATRSARAWPARSCQPHRLRRVHRDGAGRRHPRRPPLRPGAGGRIVSVVNVETSTIARESDLALPILAGPEIGVASTKAFTCQLTVLAVLAIAAARQRGRIDAAEEARLVAALASAPGLVAGR